MSMLPLLTAAAHCRPLIVFESCVDYCIQADNKQECFKTLLYLTLTLYAQLESPRKAEMTVYYFYYSLELDTGQLLTRFVKLEPTVKSHAMLKRWKLIYNATKFGWINYAVLSELTSQLDENELFFIKVILNTHE